MSAVETPQSKDKAISQATLYASLPKSETAPASSNSGRYVPSPKQQIYQPEEHPINIPYSESEIAQYSSIHPATAQMPNLTDVDAVKGNEAVYNYVKNQPIKSEPSQVSEMIVQSNKTFEDKGLVSIYAGTETKNGVTTETTITPGVEQTYELKGTQQEQLAQLQNLKADTRVKMELALGILQPEHSGGEAVSFLRMPLGKTLGEKNIGTSSNDIQETRITDPLQFAVGLGSGLISKGTGLLAKVLLKEGNPLTEVTIEESKNIKVPNTKTTTGIIGTEESQTRGTAQFGKTGVSSSSTGLGGGGQTGIITPKPTTTSAPSITGVFEKTETPGKGTTGVFQGDIKKGLSTSTPDLRNTKLEYISNSLGSNKGGEGGGGKVDLGGEGSKTVSTSKPLFSGKSEDVLKSFTSKSTKTETIRQEQVPSSKQKEDTFLKSFKSAEQIVSTSLVANKSKTTLTETIRQEQKPKNALSLLEKNVQDKMQVTSQKEKLKPESLLVIKSKSDLFSQSIQQEKEKSLFVFKQSNVQDLASKQKQEQITTSLLITKTTNETHPNNTPDKTPNPSTITIPFEEKKRRGKKLKSRPAKEVNFLGNAPVSDVIGLTRRADITYGNKITAGLVRKDISHTKSRKPSKYNLYEKLSANKSTSVKHRPISTQKPKNEFYKKPEKTKSLTKKLRL